MSRRSYRATEIIARHDSGRFTEDIDEMLAQVAREVTRYGGKGTVTIQIEVKPNGDYGGLAINPTCKRTLPRRAQPDAFFYSGAEGELFRDPPPDEAENLLREVTTKP